MDGFERLGARSRRRSVTEGGLRQEIRGPALWLTIDRPDRRNALSPQTVHDLQVSLDAAAADDSVRVIVLTGAGDRAFCTGADLTAVRPDAGPAEDHERREPLGSLLSSLIGHPKPAIARVNGLALAGGFGIALACDLIVAADTAEFGTPEVNVGLWPFMITAVIQRNLPRKVATEMMLTGRRMPAAEAERWGIVNRVVGPSDLDGAVDALAEEMASKSPLVLRVGKESFRRAQDMPFDDALAYLNGMLSAHLASEDLAEGVAAFLGKRRPEWKGR